MTRRILALDPASQTGYAHSNGAFGVWDLRIKGHGGHRLALLRNRILTVHAIDGIDEIVCEDAAYGSVRQFKTQLFHAELRGVIRMVAWEIGGAPTIFYKPTSIKKFATGSGRAGKEQMIRAAQTLLGKTPRDDNEADALWLLHMRLAEFEPATGKPRKRKPRGKQPKLFR